MTRLFQGLELVFGLVGALIVLILLSGSSLPFQSVGNSVVKLTGLDMSGGTGFVVKAKSGNPVTVTNWHVCRLGTAGAMWATKEGAFKNKALKILKDDNKHDLCILEAAPMPALTLGDEPTKFTALYVVGHPLLRSQTPAAGYFVSEVEQPILMGSPSDPECNGFRSPWGCIQTFTIGDTTVPTLPGGSGSPVVDRNGRIVGVVNSVDAQTGGAGVVPLRFVRDLLEQF